MSMTAYDTRVSRKHARNGWQHPVASDKNDDTRPSGERESGSYSGTRQRNRIQFGPS